MTVTSPQSLKGSYSANVEKNHRAQQRNDHKRIQGGSCPTFRCCWGTYISSSDGVNSSLCVLCKSKHDLNSCKSFISKSLSDRKAFLKDKSLSFGCFNLDIFQSAENKERHARYVQKCIQLLYMVTVEVNKAKW